MSTCMLQVLKLRRITYKQAITKYSLRVQINVQAKMKNKEICNNKNVHISLKAIPQQKISIIHLLKIIFRFFAKLHDVIHIPLILIITFLLRYYSSYLSEAPCLKSIELQLSLPSAKLSITVVRLREIKDFNNLY